MAAAGIELRSTSAYVAATCCSNGRSNFSFRFSASTSVCARSPQSPGSRPSSILPRLRCSSMVDLSFSLHSRLLRASTKLDEEIILDSGEDWHEEEEIDGDDEEEEYPSDVELLEEEAKKVAREFSQVVSRELRTEDDTYLQKEWVDERSTEASNKHIPDNLLPRVAIVGRPNVGKSALFNRLVGGNKAIVVDEPGVTRDRLYGRGFWGNHEFMVVDTGGVVVFSKSQDDVMEELAITKTIGMDGIPLPTRDAAVAKMPSMIEKQAKIAVEEASVIIFLADGQRDDCIIHDEMWKNPSLMTIKNPLESICSLQ